MAIIKNKKKKKINSSIPYDQQNKIEKIKLLCVIVNRSQANFYINTFNDAGVSCVFDVFGEGTAPKEMQEIMGIIDSRKSLIVCIVKESMIDKITKIIQDRFSISKQAKGISFMIPITSVAGVFIYKYLTNNRVVE